MSAHEARFCQFTQPACSNNSNNNGACFVVTWVGTAGGLADVQRCGGFMWLMLLLLMCSCIVVRVRVVTATAFMYDPRWLIRRGQELMISPLG